MPAPPAAAGPSPASYARHGPAHLEGEVEDIREIEVAAPKNWAGGTAKTGLALILLPLHPLLVLGGLLFRGSSPKKTQKHYILGIRRSDGREEQARIEGDPLGALPRRGDHVSLWGSPRYGVLVVRRGYNHSVHAEIRVRRA